MGAKTETSEDRNYNIVELLETYHAGGPDADAALIEIFTRNEPLIGHIIRKRFPTFIHEHYQDLFSCGKVGLLNAINRYDPSKSKPSTFFTIYIHHEVYAYITKNITKTSAFKAGRVTEVSYAMQRLEDRGITEPDPEQVANEIAAYTGKEKPDLAAVADAMAIRAASQTKDYTSDDYLDSLMHDFGEDPEHAYLEKEREQTLASEFKRLLTAQEKLVLTRIHDLDGRHLPGTHMAIAKELGIQPDQVRAIQQRALRKLKKSKLADLYNDRMTRIRHHAQGIEVQFKPTKETLANQDLMIREEVYENANGFLNM